MAMSDQHRRQLAGKRKQRIDAEKEAAKQRKKEADARAAATKARAAAARSSSETTARSKLKEADRREEEANKAGIAYARSQEKAAKYAAEEAKLADKLAKAEERERRAAEQKAEQGRLAAERRTAAQLGSVSARISAAETQVGDVLRQLREPKPEPLRVLMLGASSGGELRVGREQTRIRNAVDRAAHRDRIEVDVRPAATVDDLLDGITRFRPHVVHFSGHSSENLITFEEDIDVNPADVVVSADAFAAAVAATDEPPLLVVLNSCRSAAQIDRLVDRVVPFAIGMTEEIADGEAIVYAAQFYAAVANGQSVEASHLSGQAALQLAGLPAEDLPRLAHALDVDPRGAVLVIAPNT